MCRRLVVGVLVLGAASVPRQASAQSDDGWGASLKAEPEPAATMEVADAGGESVAEQKKQLLGGTLGVAAGGRVAAGGVRIAGSYLYRLTDSDWLDTGVGFTFGSGDPNCFRDRSNDLVCDHGFASGFSAEVAVAVRRDLTPQGQFVPFIRAGLALQVVSFSSDDVIGIALPLLGSGGVRARVHPVLSVVAQIDLRVGWGLFNRGLGLEPQASAALGAGVEFDLD